MPGITELTLLLCSPSSCPSLGMGWVIISGLLCSSLNPLPGMLITNQPRDVSNPLPSSSYNAQFYSPGSSHLCCHREDSSVVCSCCFEVKATSTKPQPRWTEWFLPCFGALVNAPFKPFPSVTVGRCVALPSSQRAKTIISTRPVLGSLEGRSPGLGIAVSVEHLTPSCSRHTHCCVYPAY